MKRLAFLAMMMVILSSGVAAWGQKPLPTVRIGIEAPAGTNSHYFVTKQAGLFQKYGLNLELISFPGGTVGMQSLIAGDIQFATQDGVATLTANLRGANIYFVGGMINTFPFLILSRPEVKVPADLRGKKIVISRFGSSSDTAARAAVEKYGLKPDKDVSFSKAAVRASVSRRSRPGLSMGLLSARRSIWPAGSWVLTKSSIYPIAVLPTRTN
jgi:ABC-type nitrate/sulfonate/bicarbonate transport system substrate-binding protein